MPAVRKVNVPFLKLKQYRMAAGLTQRDVCHSLGVFYMSCALWEAGKLTMPVEHWHAFLDSIGRAYEPMPPHGRMLLDEAPEEFREPSPVMAKLKQYRIQAGYTQAQVAKLMETKPVTYRNWEQGLSPIPERRWHQFLSVTGNNPKEPMPGSEAAKIAAKEAQEAAKAAGQVGTKSARENKLKLPMKGELNGVEYDFTEDVAEVCAFLKEKGDAFPESATARNAALVGYQSGYMAMLEQAEKQAKDSSEKLKAKESHIEVLKNELLPLREECKKLQAAREDQEKILQNFRRTYRAQIDIISELNAKIQELTNDGSDML